MCQISNKLKLCTCSTNQVENLKHYWIWYRPESSDVMCIGEAFPPYDVDLKMALLNETTIRKRINESDVFDFDMKPKPGDRLHIHIQNNKSSIRGTDFVFTYKNKKWALSESFYPEHLCYANKIGQGKIKNPMLRSASV